MEKETFNGVASRNSTVAHATSQQAKASVTSRVHPKTTFFQDETEYQLPFIPMRATSVELPSEDADAGVASDHSLPATAAPEQTASDMERIQMEREDLEFRSDKQFEEGLPAEESPGTRRRRCRTRWYMGCGCFGNAKNAVLRLFMTGFEKYASVVYDHPWIFIFLSLLATAGMSAGVFLRTPESDAFTLYSLSGSPSQLTKDRLLNVMPPDRLLFVLVTGKSNILTRETLTRVDAFLQGIESLTLERDSVTTDEFNHKLVDHDRSRFPKTITFDDVCTKDGSGKCEIQSILDVYPSRSQWGVEPIVSLNWPVVMNPVTHRVYRLDALLGKITTSVLRADPGAGGQSPNTTVDEAEAMLVRIDLRGEPLWKPYTAAFEKRILDYILNQDFGPEISVTPKAERSSYDELKRVSTLDLAEWFRLCSAVLLVFLYTSVVNSSTTYRTKLVPSAMGAFASLLGYLGGAGLVYLCGVRHTTPAEATPFLALGIGVDDLFVIINAYSLTYLHPNPKERVVDAVRDAGLSITITTLTNVVTFIIGALSPYYSISMFCIVTAGALMWGYVLCLTFFLAGLSLDARRESRKEPLSYALFWRFVPCGCRRSKHMTQLSPALPITAEASGLEDPVENEETVTADPKPPRHGEDLLTTYQLAALMVLYKKYASPHASRGRRLFERMVTAVTGETDHTHDVAEEDEAKTPREGKNEIRVGPDERFQDKEGREETSRRRRLSSHIRDMNTEESVMLLKDFEKEMNHNPENLLKLYHPEPLGNPGRRSRRFFRDYYGRFLRNTAVKATVLMLFAAITALAIYGATTLKFGLSLKHITPQASYLRDFYDFHETMFSSYGEEVTVFFPEHDRWEDRDVQIRYLEMVKELSQQEWAVVITDGMSVFLQHAMPSLRSGDRAEFVARLKAWLERDPVGQNFTTFFKFASDDLRVWQFRYWMPHKDNTTTLYYWLKEGKDIVRAGRPFFHGEVHAALAVIWESDPKILPFTLTNLSIALVCILAISLLLIPNLTSAVIVVIVVSLVDLWLFGFMALIDLPLSMVSMVNLLISIGYSVDFTIHVAHTFTHCVGTSREDRMVETMIVMGAPVTHGMLSTLLAVLAMAGSPKYILEVFFKMMLMVIVFAYTAGMVLLPVVLTLLGPLRSYGRKHNKAVNREGSQLVDMKCGDGSEKERGLFWN